MIANHQEFVVSLEQLQELELALASVKREASSPIAFVIQATSIQKRNMPYSTRHRYVSRGGSFADCHSSRGNCRGEITNQVVHIQST